MDIQTIWTAVCQICSDMCNMCDMYAAGVRYRPPRWQVRVDTRAWSSAVVDMAEGGDTMEKIAADEMARIRELPDVFRAMSNKTKAQAREDAMLKQMDAEMATRREAVTKRLRIALQREAQVAKEERPVKKVRKHHRMEIDDNATIEQDNDGDEVLGGSSDKSMSWRKVCCDEPQEVWDDMASAHAVVVVAIGYSKPLKEGWPPGGRGSGKLDTNPPRSWTDTSGNLWAIGKVLSGRNKDKYGIFVRKGQGAFNVNAPDDVRSSVSRTIYHDMHTIWQMTNQYAKARAISHAV